MPAAEPGKPAQPRRTHTLHKPTLHQFRAQSPTGNTLQQHRQGLRTRRCRQNPTLAELETTRQPAQVRNEADCIQKTPPEAEYTGHITNEPQHLRNYITWNVLHCVLNSTINQANQAQHPWLRNQQSTPTSTRRANNNEPASPTPARRGYTPTPNTIGAVTTREKTATMTTRPPPTPHVPAETNNKYLKTPIRGNDAASSPGPFEGRPLNTTNDLSRPTSPLYDLPSCLDVLSRTYR
jgi:hypothetical protein